MEERILELKKLFDNGINRDLFLQLISNSTNGPIDHMSAYSNNFSIEDWLELYSVQHLGINVNEEQLKEFFQYMSKYYGKHFGRNQDKFYVYKSLTNEEKSSDKFEFEITLLTAFSLI